MNFIFDTFEEVYNEIPFSYFKYQGSRTSPPCEEAVTWFVVSEIFPVSSTVLVMFRDVLNIPL